MRFLFRLTVILGVLAFGTVVLGNLAERWVIYPFDSTEASPHDAGLERVDQIQFENDNETLIAWVAKPKAGKPVIFYLHGNAGNLAARAGRFDRFISRGYGLFAPAYRGSSGSSGSPSEAALIWDVETTYHAMFQHFPDLTSRQVVLYGESLGAAVTIALLNTPAMHPDKAFGPPAATVLKRRA
ncbi:hypothetical protein SAMN05444000_1171 [Shimia gijangensis]|uniref:Serine aminopeptidase, S33 n=1 Tax=Shimia gijangensis TaxID=1470563 RepID=A0A1M6NXZ2_9RHOB|nr:hypothetical protein [Shimia gijangensis]SHK00511.1 hypothetical protein SAMN05444000_1171 [Shimia gijangensis]